MAIFPVCVTVSVFLSVVSLSGVSAKQWTKVNGENMTHVSVGRLGIWAVGNDTKLYYKNGTYGMGSNMSSTGNWIYVTSSHYVQVDVGTDIVVGVIDYGFIIILYKRLGISVQNPYGTSWSSFGLQMTHLSVPPGGAIWCIKTDMSVHRVKPGGGIGRDKLISGAKLVQISAGQAGVWGVDTHGCVYYRNETFNNGTQDGSGWTKLTDDKMDYVSSGKTTVWSVSSDGRVWHRTGMSASNPTGDSWSEVTGETLKKVEIYETSDQQHIWGVNSAGDVLTYR